VEMEDAIDKLPDELSGGMRRRVSIARAFISRPPVVLYDSPTAGLDPITSQTIIILILRLRDTQGVTSLLATHRLQDAFALANYRFDAPHNQVMKTPLAELASRNGQPSTTFLFLREGKVYFEGGPQAVLDSPDAYLKKFLVEARS
jgi:phospholipid/cholesterol/gamma-HCH transport system ATP-binding protein